MEDGVEDDFFAAVEVAVGFENCVRQRILDADVFATAAFEDESDFELGFFPLVEVDDGGADAEVGAGVFSGDGVDGVLAEVADFCGFADGVFGGGNEITFVERRWSFDEKKYGSSVLANGLDFFLRHFDVALDHFHGFGADGSFVFLAKVLEDDALDVVGNFGGGAADEFDEVVFKSGHAYSI